MSLDRHAQRFLKMLALSGPGVRGGVGERRRGLEHLCDLGEHDPGSEVAIRDISAPGPAGEIPIRLYRPDGAAAVGPALVYLHGGGWVAGGLRTHDGLCRRLAAGSNCVILAVDYRLAPEHPFPAGLEDALAVVRWTSDHAGELGVDTARLGLAGDSAGGNLAAAAAQILSAAGEPALAVLLLICPILDIARESPSRQSFAEGYFLDRTTLEADLVDYLPPGADRRDPRLSPLLAENLEGLPPTLIHTAQFDPFHDEAIAYAARLQAAGVAASHTDHAGMIHYFYALPRTIPYALEASEIIGGQARKALATGA